MDPNVIKSIYTNLLLLAHADRKIDPTEWQYLERFASAVNATEEQKQQWAETVAENKAEFAVIENPEDAQTALELMARIIRVDEQFTAEEQEAYIAMGKALGFSHDKIGETLRTFWNKDPLAEFEKQQQLKRESVSPPPSISCLIVTDDLVDTSRFSALEKDHTVNYCTVDNMLTQSPHQWVIFHAAPERDNSHNRLHSLRTTFPEAFVSFCARRDQAPQIGYLLEHGADKCFVEPIYPGELEKAIGQYLSK